MKTEVLVGVCIFENSHALMPDLLLDGHESNLDQWIHSANRLG